MILTQFGILIIYNFGTLYVQNHDGYYRINVNKRYSHEERRNQHSHDEELSFNNS
jgi:hypothetical protein